MDASDPVSPTDVFSKERRSAIMRAVKGRDTKPELALRKLLSEMKLRYRLHRADLPGSPDMALGPRKLAVFVHGCFWHGHHCKRGDRKPKANADYWSAKIGRNRARDANAARDLEAIGWRAIVVWECELKDMGSLKARLAAATALAPGRAEPALTPKSVVKGLNL